MYSELKSTLRRAAQKAYAQGMFAGTSGNLSCCDRNLGVMAITPSSLSYEDMCDGDIVIMDLEGNKLEGERRPSSEYNMHAEVYRLCQDVCAVVHTHSPYATALAAANKDLPVILIEMVPYFGGGIGCAPFALPGSRELGSTAVPYLRESNACLLSNHGVLTVGDSLQRACERAVYVEDAAKIYCIAQQAGGAKTIDEYNVEQMKRIFG
ncbi:MAG: class II aldolase/adducin family protein [Clostridia bacterium]|nr:class II aldolase/adducin family protein [Clostridia bacterium]